MDLNAMDHFYHCNNDTIQYLRKQYNLDKPERLQEAIAILSDWLNKQDHIVKKNYSEDYLERVIILNKGSVEKAKVKLDKIATYRTLSPQYFEPLPDLNNVPILKDVICCLLPKMTEDHYRVFIVNNKAKTFENGLMEFYKYLMMVCEYIQVHDYFNGLLLIFDFTQTNIFELIKVCNFVELQHVLAIIMEGYGMRLKAFHFISNSKSIEVFTTLLKKILSKKLGERIYVHNSVEDLYTFIPKDVMPSDFGGQSETFTEISSKWNAAIGSEHFMNHLKEMQKACTDESNRLDNKSNDQQLGVPGSFRKLNVD